MNQATDEYRAQIYRVLASQMMDSSVSLSDMHHSLLLLCYTLMVTVSQLEDGLDKSTVDRVHREVQAKVEQGYAEAQTNLRRFFELMGI